MGGGGSKSGGLYGRTVPQDRAIKRIAKKTANLKKEQYRIIDSDGNVLLEKKGSQHQVAATVGEKRENLNGNVSIHNHPDGGTFSSADISDFGYGAKEITVSSPEGTYRLINVNAGKPNQYAGWKKMQTEVQTKLDSKETSTVTLRRQAEKNLSNTKEQKQIDAINKKFMEINKSKGAEAATKYYESVQGKYDKAAKAQKEKVDAEMRRLTVEPYHKYYKENAAKYGFKYVFEKKK